jgi:hypothetical protein
VNYELCMRAVPYLALLCPQTAEQIWHAFFDRPLTLEAFPRTAPAPREIDWALIRRAGTLLRIQAALDAEPGLAANALLRGPRSLAAWLSEAAEAFDCGDVVAAFTRQSVPDAVYRGRTFGEIVLLVPGAAAGESNLPDVIKRLRTRSEVARRPANSRNDIAGSRETSSGSRTTVPEAPAAQSRENSSGSRQAAAPREPSRASRQASGEMAELIGELKRLVGGGRPLSGSRES